MPSSFTTALALELQVTGENDNTWGTRLNDNVITLLDDAVARRLSLSVAGSVDVTLAAAQARKSYHEYTGTLTASINVIVPATEKLHHVHNNTSGAFTLTVKTASGTGIAITQGKKAILHCDGTDVVLIVHQDQVSDNVITLAMMEHGTQGDILYYGASGAPTRLGAGTSGSLLTTQGAGANPTWAAGASTAITGEMRMWATLTAPSGWLICDGQAVSRSTFSDLFAVVSTVFGVGDGSTTFNLPDFRGRTIIGANNTSTPNGRNSGLNARNIGDQGGAEDHTLTVPEMPSHNHSVVTFLGGWVQGNNDGSPNVWFQTNTVDSGSAGSDNSHNNMPPFNTVLMIMKT